MDSSRRTSDKELNPIKEEHEHWSKRRGDLDVEIKQMKDLKASYGVTTTQELRRNQIKEEMSQHHSYGITTSLPLRRNLLH
ncbi:hypothetical protein Tco_1294348 [Tanacetum coccineum]